MPARMFRIGWILVLLFIVCVQTGSTVTVTNLNDAGSGSFRTAIEYANSNPGLDTIFFDVSGTLTPSTELPVIADDSTVILGGTAPGGAHSFVLDGSVAGGASGIEITSDYNIIKDLVIRDFYSGTGISLSGGYNIVQGNYIGTDETGNVAAGNYVFGIGIDSPGNLIGGYSEGEGNIICDNGAITFTGGITIAATDASSNQIIGNHIGVGKNGLPLGNKNGITIGLESPDNIIDSNIIAYNTDAGVSIAGTATGITVTRNIIFANGGLGIDLKGDGVTLNDPGDGDTGPNNLLNYPEIDSVVSQMDGSYRVYGTAAALSKVELFVAHPCDDPTRPADVSGHGEAFAYVEAADVDDFGDFVALVDASFEHFSILTATATDVSGNTSEFSDNFTLIPAPLTVVAYSPVNIIITDPDLKQFGKDADGILIDDFGSPDSAAYFETPNDSLVIYYPKLGTYIVEFVTETGADPTSTYSAIIRTDGTQSATIVANQQVPETGSIDTYTYDIEEGYYYENADANGDDQMNISDAVYIINHVFKGGPPPDPWLSADANCNLEVNISDAVVIINHVFKGGPPPCYFEP
jgi:hypothetical protein